MCNVHMPMYSHTSTVLLLANFALCASSVIPAASNFTSCHCQVICTYLSSTVSVADTATSMYVLSFVDEDEFV